MSRRGADAGPPPEPPRKYGKPHYVIEPIAGAVYSFRVYVQHSGVIWGPEGWGWHAITLRGARRRGERELRAYVRAEERRERLALEIRALRETGA